MRPRRNNPKCPLRLPVRKQMPFMKITGLNDLGYAAGDLMNVNFVFIVGRKSASICEDIICSIFLWEIQRTGDRTTEALY